MRKCSHPMAPPISSPTRLRAGGFTLIEVLVALVVLAIGLLGIAALYIDSLRASRTALLRTQAIAVASDLADRIRVNRAACDATACAYTGEGTLTASCELRQAVPLQSLPRTTSQDGTRRL